MPKRDKTARARGDSAQARLHRNIQYWMTLKDIHVRKLTELAGKKGSWGSMYLQQKRKTFPLDRVDAVAEHFGTTRDALLWEEAGNSEAEPQPRAPSGPPTVSENLLHFEARSKPSTRLLHHGPPTWTIVEAEYADWWIDPPLSARLVIGTAPKDFLFGQQLDTYQALLQKAWDSGEKVEFYYSVVKSGEQFSLRNVFHRQGDFVTAEVYEISAHAIAKWDLPLDLTQPLDRTKADSEHRRWVVHCGGPPTRTFGSWRRGRYSSWRDSIYAAR